MKPLNILLLVNMSEAATAAVEQLASQLGLTVKHLTVTEGSQSIPGLVPIPPMQPVNPAVDSPVPVPIAAEGGFQLLQPDYDCVTNEITFHSTGKPGQVEYMAPGVKEWTTNPGPHRVDAGPVADGKPLTLNARQNGQQAPSLRFDFRQYCAKK